MDQHLRNILDRNITFIRDLLLDGALVQEGVIDRKMLVTALSGKVSQTQSTSGEIIDFVCTEAWLRRWRNQGWRAAA
jgi:asparagine synthase (glutamine-hydrolysing)